MTNRTRRPAARSRSTTNRLAVSYVRVSSQEQEREGFSISAQRALIHRYATSRGLKILREFEDVETAKRAGRRSFTEMVTFLRRMRRCGVLLVEKVDRLSRNLKDWVTLDELNLEIHFIKDNDIYSHASRSSDKLMVGFRMLMAKAYIDNLSEETCKGQQEKATQGLWPSCAPLGYDNTTGPDGKRCIVPDSDRAALIRRLFERYATGRYSLIDLTAWARREGLVSRKGHVLSKATVHHILRNRIYSGDFDWSGTTYHGIHLPVVNRELWECVQDVMDGRYRTRPRRAKHEFAFSRLITCGHCGCALVGERKKARYVYYHCTGYRGKCSEPYTREEVLEAEFTTLLHHLAFDAEVMAWLAEALRQTQADDRAYTEEAIKRLHADRARIAHRLEAMYVDKLDGRVEADFYDRKAAEWRRAMDTLRATIDEAQTTARTYLPEGVRLLELARRAPDRFETQEPHEKRRLLNFVVSNCTWKNGRLSATWRQPFDMLAVAATASRTPDGPGGPAAAHSENWLLRLDSNQQPSG